MKLKRIMLTAIVLLAILTVSAASAADVNSTSDNQSAKEQQVSDSEPVLSDAPKEIMGDDEDTEEAFNITVPDNIRQGVPFKVTFKGPQDLNGDIEVYDDDISTGSFKNGSATINMKLSSAGVQDVKYEFMSTYYSKELETYDTFFFSSSFRLNVSELFNISIPDPIYKGGTVKITCTGQSDLNGEIMIDYGTDLAFATVKNGKATVTIKNFPKKKSVNFEFYSKNSNIYLEQPLSVRVVEPPIIKADNFKTSYSSQKQYKVQVLDNTSKPVGAGKTVTFELSGYDNEKGKTVKYATKTATTDKNGYAKVRFDVASGEYKVKIKSTNSKTVTKKYVVNSIVKPTQIYSKHGRIKSVTAKKFKFGAALKKVDGKYLKGKNVKFTFYRQDYKGKINHYYWGRLSVIKTLNLKTNSKGVAKVTYAKLPFKVTKSELEGLTILVKVQYGKDEQWVDFNVYSLSPITYYFI